MLGNACLSISFVKNTNLAVLFHVGNHTVAVIKGHEDYGLLKMSCSKIFDDINKLVRAGHIKIKDQDVNISWW